MIDVLHLIDSYRIGGPGKTIINSARYIDTREYRVHVASFTSAAKPHNEFATAVRAAGIPYLELPETRRFNWSHVSTLRGYVRRHQIRILHAHGYRTDVMGYVATRGLPVAVVTTHHGWIRNNSRQQVFARLALRLCTRFEGVELVSDQMREELPAAFRQSDRVAIVRNGIVLEDYRPQGRRDVVRRSLGVKPDDVLVGTIGRLSIEKGCLEMVDTFAIVASRRSNVRLAFIGEGPLQAELHARVRDRGLDGRVDFVPHQTTVQPYYDAIDMLVSPSHTEGLSNVILEALTSGKPVVATRVGGNGEIITDGVSGLLVPPKDPEQLARAILRVIEEPALEAQLIQGGTARVRDEFDFDLRMRREEAFYRRAVSRVDRTAPATAASV